MNTSELVNRLTYHRTRQGPFLDYLDKVDGKLSSQVAGCGSWLHVREWELSGQSRLRNANFCKRFLVCTCCAARRAAKLNQAYTNRIEVLRDMYPGMIPAMITLTLLNGPDLPERILKMKFALKSMFAAARKVKSSKSTNKEPLEWNKVLGSVRSTEIKIGKRSGLWHVHVHIFVLLTEYINPFHLSAEWERFTGDSKIVDVRKCKNGIREGLEEVLKYVSKPSDLKPEQLYHLYEAAKGSRFVDPGGLLRGVPEPCIDNDDDEGLHGPYRDFILLWSGWGYQMQSVGHRLEILKPGDPGYGAPRELIYHSPEDPDFDAGVAFPPEHLPAPRAYYPPEP
jgi:hypothetical protein